MLRSFRQLVVSEGGRMVVPVGSSTAVHMCAAPVRLRGLLRRREGRRDEVEKEDMFGGFWSYRESRSGYHRVSLTHVWNSYRINY